MGDVFIFPNIYAIKEAYLRCPLSCPLKSFKSKAIPNQLKAPGFTEDLSQLFRQQS